MTLNDIFSTNVRKARLSQGLSQEKLADKAKLHRTYISLVERKKRNISLNNVEKIARALNIPAYTLLKEEKDND